MNVILMAAELNTQVKILKSYILKEYEVTVKYNLNSNRLTDAF